MMRVRCAYVPPVKRLSDVVGVVSEGTVPAISHSSSREVGRIRGLGSALAGPDGGLERWARELMLNDPR